MHMDEYGRKYNFEICVRKWMRKGGAPQNLYRRMSDRE